MTAPGCEENETRDDKLRLHGGCVISIYMESASRVRLRHDAGNRKYFIGRCRFGMCGLALFSDQQRKRENDACLGGQYCGSDFARNLFQSMQPDLQTASWN